MWSVIFVFLSYLGRNFVKGEPITYSLHAEKESNDMFFMFNSTFCAKISAIGENFLYQVSGGVEEVRSMYNPAGELVDCSLTVNQMQVKSFMHICRLGSNNQMPKLEELEIRFAQKHIIEAKSNCLAFQRKLERRRILEKITTQPVKKENYERENSVSAKVFRRSKRGFTYPGTLWCGAGNMADHYNNLGEFAETDSCCRVHDHCPYVIHAFSSKYGYTNFKWHSICHCDCDNALKDCLRKVNDTSSRVVGQAFFNVMEVPCFEFIYEEQCVERHWYGVCKKYEKLPVAVAKESIPYDFGGIDVIDVLTLAPPKQESEKAGEEDPTESTMPGSQTTSGPEEPSLSNVVTAAEDFIKVLATVSTSQSSTTENIKGETQTSEKKKKKKLGKKKKNSKKRKEKGKGRKKKQRVSSGSQGEEAAPVTPPGCRAEEVIDRSNFVDETSGKIVHLNRNRNDFIEGKEEPSNDVMKDQPIVYEESAYGVSTVTSPSPVKKVQRPQEKQAHTESTETQKPQEKQAHTESTETAPLSTTTRPHNTTRQRSRNGRKRQSKTSQTFSLEGVATDKKLPIKTTEALAIPSSTSPTARAEQPVQQSLESHSEKGPVINTAKTTPIVAGLKSTRHGSMDKKDRNKRRRVTSTPPTEEVAFKHSTEDKFEAIARIGSATVVTITTARTPDTEWESSSVTTTTDTSTNYVATSVLSAVQNKRQQLKERGGRKRMRKVGLPLWANFASLQSASEDSGQMLTTTDCTSILTVPTRPTGQEALHSNVGKVSGRGRPTATAGPPIVTEGRHGLREREGRKRRKTAPTVFNDGVTLHKDNETEFRTNAAGGLRLPTVWSKVEDIEELKAQTPGDCTNQTLCTVQSSRPPMSLITLTLKKIQEQLGRKRRRKARLLYTRMLTSS